MKRHEILDRAKELVNGAREREYAPPKKNFQRIADLWSIVLGITVTPEQVALCMNQVKVTRLIESPKHGDSWIDIAGYAACGGEVAEIETKQNNKLPSWGFANGQ